MSPLVSVIVPNYNHSAFLNKRLDSIYKQTYNNFEVILLDDASNDNSSEILNSYKANPRTSHIIINKKNSGSPFIQWKKGVELAKGELIWIAESDDFSDTRFLEKLVQPFISHKNIGLSYCQSVVVNDKGEELYINTKWTDDLDNNRWSHNYQNIGIEECKNYLVHKCTIPNASAVVFKKSLATDFPLDFKMAGDWWMWINILQKSDIAYTSIPYNFFRTHDNTTRVLNSLDKKQLNLDEEVRVLNLLKKTISSSTYNNCLKKVYKKYLRIIPLRLLLINLLQPHQYRDTEFKFLTILKLTVDEVWFRFKRKLSI